MTRIATILPALLCCVFCISTATALAAKKPSRPNILYIMADDHSAQAISCYGSRLAKLAPTPTLDRLANEGARLDRVFCTNSICVPSRASILTGLYSHKNGVRGLSDSLDPSDQNVAKLIKSAGYKTAVIGKWHLKTDPAGFDHWEILRRQGKYFNPTLHMAAGATQYEGQVTDIITDRAIRWLDEQPKDQPFMLMCQFKTPHEPWGYAYRYDKLYEDVTFPEPASLWEDQSHRSLATRDRGYTMETLAARFARKGHSKVAQDYTGMDAEQRRRVTHQKLIRDYMRCIQGIDDNVARLLKRLDELGLWENTVVIYTSDQGYFLGEHGYMDKRWMFEESLQMPFLIRYPGVIKPGTTNDDFVINTDFAPTLLDIAGLPTPRNMQGRSFLPCLTDATPDDWRDAMYYRYFSHSAARPAHVGIRTARYKLMWFYGNAVAGAPKEDSWELYDLSVDPKEVNNIYREQSSQETIDRLEARMWQLAEELGDQRPEVK